MQNKKIIESPGLLVAGTVWCALCIVICGLCTWVIHNGFVITTTYRDWIGCQIIFVFMALYIIGCFIMALPRWLRLILFDEKMIVIKSVYGAKAAMHYADINDILLYREQRGVRLISFIVISKDKLYIKELSAKKAIKGNDRIIMMRDRKATRMLIYQALSSTQRSKFGYRLL